jgi:hypothetical protein
MQISKEKKAIMRYYLIDGLYELLFSVLLLVFVGTTPYLIGGHTGLLTLEKLRDFILYFLVFTVGAIIIKFVRHFFVHPRLGNAKVSSTWNIRTFAELFSPLVIVFIAFCAVMIYPLSNLSSQYNVPFSFIYYLLLYTRLVLELVLIIGVFFYLNKIYSSQGFLAISGLLVIVSLLMLIIGVPERTDILLLSLSGGLFVDGARNLFNVMRKKHDNK